MQWCKINLSPLCVFSLSLCVYEKLESKLLYIQHRLIWVAQTKASPDKAQGLLRGTRAHSPHRVWVQKYFLVSRVVLNRFAWLHTCPVFIFKQVLKYVRAKTVEVHIFMLQNEVGKQNVPLQTRFPLLPFLQVENTAHCSLICVWIKGLSKAALDVYCMHHFRNLHEQPDHPSEKVKWWAVVTVYRGVFQALAVAKILWRRQTLIWDILPVHNTVPVDKHCSISFLPSHFPLWGAPPRGSSW